MQLVKLDSLKDFPRNSILRASKILVLPEALPPNMTALLLDSFNIFFLKSLKFSI